MARPRAATYDDQRDAILARAAELFARHGYTATTMNQVAAACGLTKATLYHYMRDKQDLLLHSRGRPRRAAGGAGGRGLCATLGAPKAARLRALIRELHSAPMPGRSTNIAC